MRRRKGKRGDEVIKERRWRSTVSIGKMERDVKNKKVLTDGVKHYEENEGKKG